MVLCRSTLFELRVGAPGTAQFVSIPLARAAACWPLRLHMQPKSVRALKYPQMPVGTLQALCSSQHGWVTLLEQRVVPDDLQNSLPTLAIP